MIASQRQINQFTILDIQTNIDTPDAAEFLSFIHGVIAEGKKHLVVNFSGIDFLCSRGFNVLVRIWKELAEAAGSLQIIAGDPEIDRLLRELSIPRIMPVHSNEEQFLVKAKELTEKPAPFGQRRTPDWVIVDLHRPISILDGYKELDALMESLLLQGRKQIAINLAAIGSLYSELAGLIISWNRQITGKSGTFRLVGINGIVADQLTNLGVNQLVSFCSEQDLLGHSSKCTAGNP